MFRPVSFHITNITSTWFICFVSHVCSAGSVWMFVQIRYYDGMVLCVLMIQQYNLFDPWIRDAVFVILVWNYYSINYNFVHQSKFTYSTFLWILNFFKYTLCVPGFFCVKLKIQYFDWCFEAILPTFNWKGRLHSTVYWWGPGGRQNYKF